MQHPLFKIKKNILILLLLVIPTIISAQQDSTDIHEITIFSMPTLKPLNWDSPSTLYSSMISCYVKTMAVKNNYLLGHIAVRLRSPLLENNELLIAQTSGTLKEKRDMIFKEKVGMAIMGASLTGRIEPEETLRKKLAIYDKRKKLGFITYRISNEAMGRILAFIKEYQENFEDGRAACEFYGGSFNPRYENEGSGCSAFGVALLDLINLSPTDTKHWAYDVNIPMDLIGGRFNNNKKIKTKSILKAKEWYNAKNGVANFDYVNYFIYDPSLIYDWILTKRNENDSIFVPQDENNTPGVYMDAREVQFDVKAPLFIKRESPNLFIDVYMKDRFQKEPSNDSISNLGLESQIRIQQTARDTMNIANDSVITHQLPASVQIEN